ncbi:MAG: protein kinase [Roseiflexus sp.]|nr:protein kinase [Roseiflexus sp.]
MSNLPERIGNYRLERRIGRGGMSQVWLARHQTLRTRQAAIKVLLSQDAEWIERFTREAEITSQLRHEHIVPIYDHGYQAPFYYTVMEYVDGGSLRDLLNQHGRLPLELAAHIFFCTAAALDYAHAHGVIHRDVSTGNILVDHTGKRVFLADFGIARESGISPLTTVNKVMGTRGFLSPEHASSATAVTHLSDIYSLGVVLYVMLTGDLPWPYPPGLGEDGGPFAPPLSLRDRGVTGVPAELDTIIRTMLALDPSKRYPSAQAAADALRQALSRHTSTTQVVTGAPASAAAPAPMSEEPHPVEQALMPDLLKAPMQEALARMNELNDPREIARLLNEWSSARPWLRRPAMGRLAAIRQIGHRNIYWYTLRVLYESREPAQNAEEPDYQMMESKLEREPGRWEVPLPSQQEFKDNPGGVVRIPGSMRVVLCDDCKGIGRTICPRCNGNRRVPAPAEPTPPSDPKLSSPATTASTLSAQIAARPRLIPCPDCQGSGGLHCKRCDGTSRLVVHKTIRWRRQAATMTRHDDLPTVDEQWLQQRCKKRKIYCEQAKGGLRPEWRLVPGIQTMIEEAERRLDANTRIVLSEVAIHFIPITEIVFDLNEWTVTRSVGSKGKSREPTLYRWYIYGFEKALPDDWRFVNWDRIVALGTTGVSLALIVALILILAL